MHLVAVCSSSADVMVVCEALRLLNVHVAAVDVEHSCDGEVDGLIDAAVVAGTMDLGVVCSLNVENSADTADWEG